jgi:SAM-dependent MidA family methyltransferase
MAIIELDRYLRLLERDDILVLGEDGEIMAAYPYSASQTIHRVEVEGKVLFANCAVDALAIPFMTRRDAVIRSKCGSCETPLRIVFEDSRISVSQPSGIQVSYLPPQPGGASLEYQCKAINFFCNEKHLEKWRSQHPQLAGKSLILKEAAEHARRTYGNYLQINQKKKYRRGRS